MTIGIGSIEGKETSYTAIEKKPGVDVIFVRDVKKKDGNPLTAQRAEKLHAQARKYYSH